MSRFYPLARLCRRRCRRHLDVSYAFRERAPPVQAPSPSPSSSFTTDARRSFLLEPILPRILLASRPASARKKREPLRVMKPPRCLTRLGSARPRPVELLPTPDPGDRHLVGSEQGDRKTNRKKRVRFVRACSYPCAPSNSLQAGRANTWSFKRNLKSEDGFSWNSLEGKTRKIYWKCYPTTRRCPSM